MLHYLAFQLFTVPIHDDKTATEELNALLQQFGTTDIVSAMADPEPSMIIDVLIILVLGYCVHWSRQNLKVAWKRFTDT